MNYYSYFSEIEDEFVRRRGSHLLVSTLDWSLMETWRQRGIPLHIVLRGINQSFDNYDKRETRGRKVNTLFFCRQAVEECYFNYLESRIGAEGEAPAAAANQPDVAVEEESVDPTFSPTAIIRYLSGQIEELERLARRAPAESILAEVLERAILRLSEVRGDIELSRDISCENLEADLTLIEQTILTGLREATPPETLTAWEKEGRKQLKAYRETMKPEIYQQTLDNFLARELRRQFQIPRLSLFYINP
ncbi:MAG: hypothetical protein ACK496_12060 [Acidobacteriota bacterium]|jgi:hypothetical protein